MVRVDPSILLGVRCVQHVRKHGITDHLVDKLGIAAVSALQNVGSLRYPHGTGLGCRQCGHIDKTYRRIPSSTASSFSLKPIVS